MTEIKLNPFITQNIVNTVEIAVKTQCSVEEQITEKAKHLGSDQANELKDLILQHKQVFSKKNLEA